MKKCPFCAEEIQDAAIKCRHCGSQLNAPPEPSAPPARRFQNVTESDARLLPEGAVIELQAGGRITQRVEELLANKHVTVLRSAPAVNAAPTVSAVKKCPFCAEEIQDAAVVCKHCGRDLVSTATAQKVEIVQAKKKTGCFTWIALIFVVIFFVVILTNYCSSVMNPTTPAKPGANAAPKPAAPAASSSPTATAAPSDLVSFKVAAHDSTIVILLVPANTTEADLTKLVNALRTARAKGTLSQFLPPTTPGGSGGPFFAVVVFVMSDPVWATTPQLKSFVAEDASEKEFGKRILASYNFSGFVNQESGTIGYKEQGHQYTAEYKKLF